MLTIERALSEYTDEVLAGNADCIDVFVRQLPKIDIQEFIESANLIRLIESQERSQKFHELFAVLDQNKQKLYNFPQVVDFRGTGDANVSKQIDDIFAEEFGEHE